MFPFHRCNTLIHYSLHYSVFNATMQSSPFKHIRVKNLSTLNLSVGSSSNEKKVSKVSWLNFLFWESKSKISKRIKFRDRPDIFRGR